MVWLNISQFIRSEAANKSYISLLFLEFERNLNCSKIRRYKSDDEVKIQVPNSSFLLAVSVGCLQFKFPIIMIKKLYTLYSIIYILIQNYLGHTANAFCDKTAKLINLMHTICAKRVTYSIWFRYSYFIDAFFWNKWVWLISKLVVQWPKLQHYQSGELNLRWYIVFGKVLNTCPSEIYVLQSISRI